jgi:hypothetical protein
MVCFELESIPADTQDHRGFVGGIPPLPAGTDWPTCRLCRDSLVHFLDVELPRESAPFQAGSRLQVFACRQHDDIAGTIYSDYGRFGSAAQVRQLPDRYWEISDGHYLIRLLPPGAPVVAGSPETRLALRNLRRTRHTDSQAKPKASFKLFGYPDWAQDPEEHVCCCGAAMQLLLQVPDGIGFDMAPGVPAQPNSFSGQQYCLFLGNALYLLACTRQCHPQALWPVLQN